MKLMIKRGIDINNTKVNDICVLVVSDRLHKFKYEGSESKESFTVDLNKINPKPKCLLVARDSISFDKNKHAPDIITLSRVLFNKN